jgi:hypothetical protein
MCSFNLPGMQTWEVHDPPPSRPIAAPLERCAEFLDVDLATIGQAAAHVQPDVRVDGTKVWSLMQLERQLRPTAYGRVRGGYIAAAGSEPPTPEAYEQLRWCRAARSVDLERPEPDPRLRFVPPA